VRSPSPSVPVSEANPSPAAGPLSRRPARRAEHDGRQEDQGGDGQRADHHHDRRGRETGDGPGEERHQGHEQEGVADPLAVTTLVLLPAIVLGYAVRAAEKEDRQQG
jgi:hypothetical protein